MCQLTLFQLTLYKPFAGIFSQFLGFLQPNGTGSAQLQIPAGANPDLAGVTVHLAFTTSQTLGTVEFASNAVPLTFVP